MKITELIDQSEEKILKSLAITGPGCYTHQESEKYRDEAIALALIAIAKLLNEKLMSV
jgi:hypothetical protein